MAPLADNVGHPRRWPCCPAAPRCVTFEIFNGINGTAVADLTSHASFPNAPSETRYLTALDTRQALPSNSRDNYGGRLRALFVPPASGNWIFYIKSDDASQLFLNPFGSDPAGKVLLTAEPACATPQSGAAMVSPPMPRLPRR